MRSSNGIIEPSTASTFNPGGGAIPGHPFINNSGGFTKLSF